MGTTYTIKWIPSATSPDPSQVKLKIEILLKSINQLMSTYDKTSEISRFNRSKSKDWFPVSRETYIVVQKALEFSEISKGRFDVTLDPLIALWGFGNTLKKESLPRKTSIDRIIPRIGYNKLELKKGKFELRKKNPNLSVNLSAIAKGYAVDQVAKLMEKEQIVNFLVEIGGEIQAKGAKSENQPWIVAIESPFSYNRKIQKRIRLQKKGMATSGNYRNYFEKNGFSYSHIIDPITASPITHNLASVSVIHASTMEADAWATTLMVMGPDKGLELARKSGLAVFFIVRTNEGFREVYSKEFETYIID